LAEKFVFGGSSLRKKEFDDHNFEYNETERKYMDKIKRKIERADTILNKVENEGLVSTSPPMDITIVSIREIYLAEVRQSLDIASLGLRLIAIYNEAARASLASTDLNIDQTPILKDPWRLSIDPNYIRDNKFHKIDIPNVRRFLKAVLDEEEQKVNIPSLTAQVEALQKQIESHIEEFTKQAKVQETIRQLIQTVVQTVEVLITIKQIKDALRGRGGSGGGGGLIRCALAVGGTVRYSNGGAVIVKSLISKQIAERIKAGVIVISAMAMSSAGSGVGNVPTLENVRGATGKNSKRDRTLFLQRGLVVRRGPGGIIDRVVRTFIKITRDDKGFEIAKKAFLKELSKDPKVIEFFGADSIELQNLKNGLLPSKYWEVRHNIPATAKVKGVITNDHANFSLMPKWVHNSVSAEYNRILTAGGKSYAFPIFDRTVLWRRAFLPLKNLPKYKYNPPG
jgi:hypothetical protein